MRKKGKEDEKTVKELNSAHRREFASKISVGTKQLH